MAEERTAHLDGYTCNWVTIRDAHDLAPMLAHLPTGRCECPHWGVVNAGRLTVTYADRVEVIEAGESFSMPPGHTPAADAGTEFVLFSPSDLLAATDAALRAGLEKLQGASSPAP